LTPQREAVAAPAFKKTRSYRRKDGHMRFETKIGIAVLDGLAVWQKLNVTAFLASAVAAERSEVIGKPYEDGSGNSYLSMFRQPVLVYAAGANPLVKARTKAVARGLATAIYTEELFKTGNDDDNRAAVRAVPVGELRLVGLAVYGPRNDVDRVLKGMSLHP
jgi:hypothetical protein